jgi:hypothetical protein
MELENKGYDKDNNEDDSDNMEETEDIEEPEEKSKSVKNNGYEYLLRLQISSITSEKIDKLKNDIYSNISQRDTLLSTTEKQLWIHDIDTFLDSYKPYIDSLSNQNFKKFKKL